MTPFRYNDYKRTLVLAHAGWWGTVAIVGLRAAEVIPQSLGSMALLTLGVAVTASLSLSRMRLSETMTQVLLVGAQMSGGTVARLPSGKADELLWHTEQCMKCRMAKLSPNPITNACDEGARLIRQTLEERHGRISA
jgi:hypothetical protein